MADIIVPSAVVEELAEGRDIGINLPDPVTIDWIEVRTPQSSAVLAMVGNLGKGETQTLALGVEIPNSIVALDDSSARRAAEVLHLKITGTLGLLLDAKRAGFLPKISLVLEQLDSLGFRLAERTRTAVLTLAEENE